MVFDIIPAAFFILSILINKYLKMLRVTCIATFLLAFSLCLENLLTNFPNKSIFFSSLNSLGSENISIELQQPHKTDTVIIKFDNHGMEDIVNLNEQVILSLQISKQFIKLQICLDKLDESYSKILERLPLNKFSEISTDIHTCFQRTEYSSALNWNLITEVLTDHNLISINIEALHQNLVSFTTNFIKWTDNSFYEILFIYDTRIFKPYQVFFYYSQNSQVPAYISLIEKGQETFENIFVFHTQSKKILKYTKNYKNSNKAKVTFKDFSYPLLLNPTFTTLGNESTFHNKLEFNLDWDAIKKNFQSNDGCLFVYNQLTEDMYIEKHEMRNHLQKQSKDFSFLASKFIDLELSSDLSDQYYFSLMMCNKIDELSKFQLSYPIHFRYQPSTEDYQSYREVVMAHPFIDIVPMNNTNVPVLSTYITNSYFSQVENKELYLIRIKKKDPSASRYDERKIFSMELMRRLRTNVRDYNIYMKNEVVLKHKIPVGKKLHFPFVLTITIGVTFIGFIMILIGLLNYMLKVMRFKKESKAD